VQYLAQCELICPVPAEDFYPQPDSAVVATSPQLSASASTPPLRDFVAGFAAKRKMLRNNLKGIVDRDHLTQLLEQLEVNHLARVEDPSVAQWVSLANELSVKS